MPKVSNRNKYTINVTLVTGNNTYFVRSHVIYLRDIDDIYQNHNIMGFIRNCLRRDRRRDVTIDIGEWEIAFDLFRGKMTYSYRLK